jgi:hypothetical protein
MQGCYGKHGGEGTEVEALQDDAGFEVMLPLWTGFRIRFDLLCGSVFQCVPLKSREIP